MNTESSLTRRKESSSKHLLAPKQSRSGEYIEVSTYSTFQSSDSNLVDVKGSYRLFDLVDGRTVERTNTTVGGKVSKDNLPRLTSIFPSIQGQYK